MGILIEVYALIDEDLIAPNPTDYQESQVQVHSDDEVPSVAIIPFDNKGAGDDVFYSYGISSDLISDITNAGLIRVAGLKDIEKLEYKTMNYEDLSKLLLVRYIAQGTLWKMNDIFQLSIELYDTKESKVLWTDRWQENWENLTTIKGNLSDGLLKALSTKPKLEKGVESTNTVAYEYYLKGRHKWKNRNSTEEGLVATGLLEKAIDLDNNLMDAKNVLAAAIYHQGDVEKSLKMFEENIKQARKIND